MCSPNGLLYILTFCLYDILNVNNAKLFSTVISFSLDVRLFRARNRRRTLEMGGIKGHGGQYRKYI